MCTTPRQMLCDSVCVALKPWTCMTECPSKLKYGFHLSLWIVVSCLFSLFFSTPCSSYTTSHCFYSSLKSVFLLLVVDLSVFFFGWNGFWLDGDSNDRWPSMMKWLVCPPRTWTGPPYTVYIEAVLAGTSLIGALSLLALLSCFCTHLGGRVQ